MIMTILGAGQRRTLTPSSGDAGPSADGRSAWFSTASASAPQRRKSRSRSPERESETTSSISKCKRSQRARAAADGNSPTARKHGGVSSLSFCQRLASRNQVRMRLQTRAAVLNAGPAAPASTRRRSHKGPPSGPESCLGGEPAMASFNSRYEAKGQVRTRGALSKRRDGCQSNWTYEPESTTTI
jgi:hypothetical protein